MLLELLFADHSAVDHVLALLNFFVPVLRNALLFPVLRISQVRRHFVQEERALGVVSIRHVLLSVSMLEVLELEISDGAGGEGEGEGGLVALVKEVPDVDTIRFGDEDDSGSGGGERSAGVVGAESVGRFENGEFKFLHRRFPHAKVEIVHCDQQIVVEWRPVQSQHRAVVSLPVIRELDIFHEFLLVIVSVRVSSGSNGPIDVEEVSFVRGSPEGGSVLRLGEENPGETEISTSILSNQLDL